MPAFAETAITAESLAACMLENSSETEEGALKDLMIKALQDASASELQASTMGFGMSMIALATGTCGMNITQLQEPIFEEAAEIYGTNG